MSVVSRYLNKLYLMRFGAVIFAVAGFAILFDLLDVGSRVLRRSDGSSMALLRYMVIRMPTLLADMIPLVALVAGLVTIGDLLRHRELIAMWNAGLTRAGMLLRLWPAVLLLVIGKFAIDDLGVPATVPELRQLRVADFKNVGLPAAKIMWLKSGRAVIRLPSDAAATGNLTDIVILARDEEGRLVERIDAVTAEARDQHWLLRDVVRRPASSRPAETLAELEWPVDVDLDKIALMAKAPRELELLQLIDVLAHDGYGVGVTDGHRTLAHARVAGILGLASTILLPFALARRFGRVGVLGPIWVQGLAAGFTYLVANGVLQAFGEVGLVPPVLAAWTVPVLFALLVLWLVGVLERRQPGHGLPRLASHG